MAILTSSHRPYFAAVTLYNRTPHDQIPFPRPSRSPPASCSTKPCPTAGLLGFVRKLLNHLLSPGVLSAPITIFRMVKISLPTTATPTFSAPVVTGRRARGVAFHRTCSSPAAPPKFSRAVDTAPRAQSPHFPYYSRLLLKHEPRQRPSPSTAQGFAVSPRHCPIWSGLLKG
jgi:hypothetical protein